MNVRDQRHVQTGAHQAVLDSVASASMVINRSLWIACFKGGFYCADAAAA
jgi:hypothetical protein